MMSLRYKWQRLMARAYLRYGMALFYLASLIVSFFLKKGRTGPVRKLLILKPDAIGDYLMTRNFLGLLKGSEHFGDCSFTFCGNMAYRDFVLYYDQGMADDFIWIDKNRVYWDLFYYLGLVIRVYRQYEVVIHPVASREFIFDTLVKNAATETALGFTSDMVNIIPFFRKISDRWYSILIDPSREDYFEFYRQRYFFEKVLHRKIPFEKPFLEKDSSPALTGLAVKGPYCLVFPGAQLFYRRWPARNFSEISLYLLSKYGITVVIAGSRQDQDLAAHIIRMGGGDIIDFTGKSSLAQLPPLILGARLVICNDSSAAHFAALTGTPCIVLSQMNHYARFVPYPQQADVNQTCIIPMEYQNFSRDRLAREFSAGSDASMDLITTGQVKQAIHSMMSDPGL